MIPQFPHFKSISLEDKEHIEAYTSQYKPYSDFNFTNLWIWNTRGDRMVSELNGNLVVKLSDYVTGEPFLSFLGSNNSINTARRLLEYADRTGLPTTLRYISEEAAVSVRGRNLKKETDEENFDYIFLTAQLANPTGSNFKKKRQQSNKFVRENVGAAFRIQSLSDPSVQNDIRTLFKEWGEHKKSDTKYNYELEGQALERLLDTIEYHSVVLSTVHINDTLLGFSIDEILPNRYAVSHFVKANVAYKGVYEFLNEKTAAYLLTEGVTHWNWEQDLNIEGLRQLKMSYRPIDFLKKYKVSGSTTPIKKNRWNFWDLLFVK